MGWDGTASHRHRLEVKKTREEQMERKKKTRRGKWATSSFLYPSNRKRVQGPATMWIHLFTYYLTRSGKGVGLDFDPYTEVPRYNPNAAECPCSALSRKWSIGADPGSKWKPLFLIVCQLGDDEQVWSRPHSPYTPFSYHPVQLPEPT